MWAVVSIVGLPLAMKCTWADVYPSAASGGVCKNLVYLQS